MSDYPPSYPPVLPNYVYPEANEPLPQPVRLHWGWVLLLEMLTRGLFGMVWLIVQANFVRKVRGTSKAFGLAIAAAVVQVLMTLIFAGFFLTGASGADDMPWWFVFPSVVFAIVRLLAVFVLCSELEDPPINMYLNGVMTFFFSATYFQYHLHDYVFDGSGQNFGPGTYSVTGRE